MAAASTVALAGIAPSPPSLLSSSSKSISISSSSSTSTPPSLLPIRSSLPDPSRRSFLSLLSLSAVPALFLSKDALADASFIKVEGPPPPSGGLPGTENADQARDVDLPLKDRFFLQPLPPAAAVERAKESAKDIVAVKALIEKKAWPYVQNDLRLKAFYLRYDINTIVSSKNKEEKKLLKPLVAKLFDDINNLDYAARSKSVSKAEKYYAIAVSSLNDLLAKIG